MNDFFKHPPLISVCIPVFNGSQYIRASVESVLTQTEERFELLVVDNCSTDRTAEILAEYDDPRLRIFKNEHNLGLFGNFNRCTELARGEYIVILPHDDLMLPSLLETFSCVLSSDPNIGSAYSSYFQINSKGEKIKFILTDPESRVMSGDEAFRKFIQSGPTQCVMVRRDIFSKIGIFDPDLLLSGDLNMWCRIAGAGYKVYYDKVPQNCYRLRPSSMTQHIYRQGEYGVEIFKCYQRVFEEIPPRATLHNLRNLAAQWPLRVQFIYNVRSLADGDWKAFKRHADLFCEIVRWSGSIRVVLSLLPMIFNLAVGRTRRIVRKGCS